MKVQILTTLTATALLVGTALAQDTKPAATTAKVKTKVASVVDVPFHGNAECPISGKPVKQDKFAEQDGQRVYTCCGKCEKKIAANFDELAAKAYPADKVEILGNTTCPVSGEAASAEDETRTIQGHEINFCCGKCAKKFMSNPQRGLALLKNPELKPLNNKKCLVSEKEDVEAGSFFVYKNLLIDTCCGDCADEFAADPKKYTARLKQMASEMKPGAVKKG